MSKINLNFRPMQLPKYQGVEYMSQLGEHAFPLYAKPTVKGINIMIRHGRVHFDGISRYFRNTYVRDLFYNLFDFTRINGLSVHATLRSKSVSDSTLMSILTTYEKIPADTELIITDIVEEAKAEIMTIETRSSTMQFIEQELPIKQLKIAAPQCCLDQDELDAVLETFAGEFETMDGIIVAQPGSTYCQGLPKGLPTSVEIGLSSEELAEIITHDLPEYVTENSPLSGTFGVLVGNSGYEIEAALLTKEAKSDIEKLRDSLIGKTILLATLNLPRRELPICQAIMQVDSLPAVFKHIDAPRYAREVYISAAA